MWADTRTRPFFDNRQYFWFYLTYVDGLQVGPFFATYETAHAVQARSSRVDARDTLWAWV